MNDLAQIQTIDDYFREFSHFHVKKATELLQPLHIPGKDPLPDFSEATRQPFEGQAHVIAAAIKMLDEARGMIIAEPGAGKTLMGMLTIHQHAQRSVRQGGSNGNYRAIVLCPDHLIKKWKAELEETVPGVKVTIFDAAGKGCKHLISDMSPLYHRIKRGHSGHALELDILRKLRRERFKKDAAGDARQFAQIALTPPRKCLADRHQPRVCSS